MAPPASRANSSVTLYLWHLFVTIIYQRKQANNCHNSISVWINVSQVWKTQYPAYCPVINSFWSLLQLIFNPLTRKPLPWQPDPAQGFFLKRRVSCTSCASGYVLFFWLETILIVMELPYRWHWPELNWNGLNNYGNRGENSYLYFSDILINKMTFKLD